MTCAVIAAGVFTVGLAARWRAEAAPLDVAPVAMSQLDADLAAEAVRSTDLTGQVSDVAGQVAMLRGALVAAGDTVTSDTGSAQALQARLDKAKTKLARLQGQLKAAQRRLAALNDAAARQAALNRAAAQRSSTSSGGSAAKSSPARTSGGGDDDGGIDR
jgi:chromosome segregation ATPase